MTSKFTDLSAYMLSWRISSASNTDIRNSDRGRFPENFYLHRFSPMFVKKPESSFACKTFIAAFLVKPTTSSDEGATADSTI